MIFTTHSVCSPQYIFTQERTRTRYGITSKLKSESDTISDGNSRQKLAIKSNFILTGENKFSMV